MSSLCLQIVLLTMVIQCLSVDGKPMFQGISIDKKIELNFKPLPQIPIKIIKEKWWPFGIFGIKPKVQKRSITTVLPLEALPVAPVFEEINEAGNIFKPPVLFLPNSISTGNILGPKLNISSSTIVPTLLTFVSTPKPIVSPSGTPAVSQLHQSVLITPTPPPVVKSPTTLYPIIFEGLDSIPENFVAPLPLSSRLPPSSPKPPSPPPSPVLLTNISRSAPIKQFINSSQAPVTVKTTLPPIPPTSVGNEIPKSDIVLPQSVIRGSRMVLYLGNVFVQLMSQFLTNARATFDQMTNPPPVFKN